LCVDLWLKEIMKKKETNRNKLTPAEIKKFKALLLAKLTEILGNVTSMETEALRRNRSDLSNMPTHMADLGTDNYEIENILGLMDSERKILMEINDSLNRIEDSTYGICENCGKQIPKQRLDAIPWARYCVACATLLEKGLLAKKMYEEYDRTFPDDSSDDD
jgi:DnaK suppressor protein